MLPDETDQRKWTFLTFLFIFELGSLVCGVAQSSKMLIVGRAIAGMGGSGIINGALTILASSLPLHKRPSMPVSNPVENELADICSVHGYHDVR